VNAEVMHRLMVVDDSNVIRRRIERAHDLPGIEFVGAARNGVEALEMHARLKPTLVTMDLTMPEMDGAECVEKLVARDPELRILVISALADKLAAVGARRQVLCVTHLPQIAARARHHVRVVKSVRVGRTRAGVTVLTGAERVEEWARAVARVPVRRIGTGDPAAPPRDGEVMVGGVEAVKDFGPLRLGLVAILDADQAARRPGLAAREHALATWMEAAAWARSSGRVIVQTRHPGDPAVQSLVSGNPHRFHRSELPRRADAGFPAGWPVFRVTGDDRLAEELAALEPRTLLSSSGEGQTVCLLALEPGAVPAFGRAARASIAGAEA